MKYSVEGRITFTVEMEEIEAHSENEAVEIAKKQIREYYHLNSEGANHVPEYVAFDLWAVEDED